MNSTAGVKCKLALHGVECIAHLMVICSRAATGSLGQGTVTLNNAVDVVSDGASQTNHSAQQPEQCICELLWKVQHT